EFENLRAALDKRYRDAYGGSHAGVLHTDDTPADNGQHSAVRWQVTNGIRIEDRDAVYGNRFVVRRAGTGSNQHAFCVAQLTAFCVLNPNQVGPCKRSFANEGVDLI